MKLTSSLLLLSAAGSALAQSGAARFHSYCGAFDHQIFCFGGFLGNITVDGEYDNNMYYLNLTNSGSMAELSKSWQLINTNTNGVNLEPRRYAQALKISDTELLISGGFSIGSTLSDQTIVYKASTNSWEKYANYVEGDFGGRQIYYSTGTVVPDKGVAFYGGAEIHINKTWSTETNQNISATVFNNGNSRLAGYTLLNYFNYKNPNPWSQPPQTNAPSPFSLLQSSVYYPGDKRIYYFGGNYQDTTVPGYENLLNVYHKFSYAIYFDTVTNTWGNQTLTGATSIPSDRVHHTTTMLPNNPNIMLLYGGELSNQPSSDFCYLLDFNTFKWTQKGFQITTDGANLIRTRHNTLLIDNSTLFIVNGLVGPKEIASRPLAFDVTNGLTMEYIPNYTYTPVVKVGDDSNSSKDNDKSDSDDDEDEGGISTGAIVGIVVAIVGVIVIGLIAFFFYRKNKNKVKEVELTKVTSHNEQIEVNWDEIEKQYTEVPSGANTDNSSYSPILDGNSVVHRSAQNSTPIVIPSSVDNTVVNVGPIVLKPDVAIQVSKPDEPRL